MNFYNQYDPLSKFLGCVLGSACGNALGLPVTGLTACDIRSRFGEVKDFISLPPTFPAELHCERGSWAGDIALLLGTMTAITEADGTIDVEKIGEEHLVVYEEGKRGLGRSTRNACRRRRGGRPWKDCGEPWDPVRKSGAGNSVMVKIPALGLLQSQARKGLFTFIDEATQYAMITHLGPPAIVAGVVHAATIASLVRVPGPVINIRWFLGDILFQIAFELERRLEVEYKLGVCNERISSQLSKIVNLIDEHRLKSASIEDISSWFGGGGAYAYDSFGLVYALFARYLERVSEGDEQGDHPFDPVLWAVNAGGSTEMNAAIMGSLAGTLHGIDALPVQLILGVEKSTEIIQLTEQFFETCRNRHSSPGLSPEGAEREEQSPNAFFREFRQHF